MAPGYYRFPTIHEETVVFVCEDDLWTVPAEGGIARRLTAGLGEMSRPSLSPDGRLLAFVGREEGRPDIYLMPATGGQPRRLTYLGNNNCRPVGWAKDGRLIFIHSAGQPFQNLAHLYLLSTDDGHQERINVGPARAISYGPGGGAVIGRNLRSPAHWKRYRGGEAGQIWIDQNGDGQFQPLVNLPGNLDNPIWLGERIFFLSDHEGIGNLYSCFPTGEDVQRHSDHDDYYARNAASDGRRIVYHAGGNLFLYDPSTDISREIPVTFYSSQTQRNRKFVSASKFLDGWTLHPSGMAVAITARGKPFTLANFEGAVLQHGQEHEVRYRLLEWLNDGRHLIAISDEGQEESFVILADSSDGVGVVKTLQGLDIGRPLNLKVNPCKDQILFSNHRHELMCLDLEQETLTLIDRGKVTRISGFDWSPDGKWVAYGVSVSMQRTALKLWQAVTGQIFPLTEPVLRDVEPSFDPGGKYLYFISSRTFDPVYDNLHFDLSFPFGERPYLITLQESLQSPFVPIPELPGAPSEEAEEVQPADETARDQESADGEGETPEDNGEGSQEKKKEKLFTIDTDGITERVVAFPVPEGRFGRIVGIKNGRVLYARFPAEGALSDDDDRSKPPAKGALFSYDFKERKEEKIVSHITDFDLSRDSSTVIYRSGNRLRVLKAGSKPDSNGSEPGRDTGWIDLHRVKVSVVPVAEWKQMFAEAWRLQRDHFWVPDMAQLDWVAVYDRYLPLVDRVASRAEFSDLLWEMQGELGTSHAYEFGGDYKPDPSYNQGYLGADFEYHAASDSWQITQIVRGDVWEDRNNSPLNKPGLDVKAGDFLLAVNKRQLGRDFSPQHALVNMAGEQVLLTVRAGDNAQEAAEDAAEGAGEPQTREVLVTAVGDEAAARYREWVDNNRHYVHEKTKGRIGYVHIPDMGANGFAEFHRGYLAEVDHEGLIVDVRFNGGGHVSQLILEKLARRRIGYDRTRWSEIPIPYPEESVLGPMVALTNEYAGSDGDIFCHSFKLMGLGPLVGKRTWGGVIGIYPRHALVDGTTTTQPEYSFWFEDVGWGVENYGTDPDIEVDNRPQDYAQGVDAQLEKTIDVIMTLLNESQPSIPEFGPPPSRSLPRLRPRNAEE